MQSINYDKLVYMSIKYLKKAFDKVINKDLSYPFYDKNISYRAKTTENIYKDNIT